MGVDLLHGQPTKAKPARAQPVACDLCGEVVSRPDVLIRHKQNKHRNAADAIPCISCIRVFFSKAALAQHVQLGKCSVDVGPQAQATRPATLVEVSSSGLGSSGANSPPAGAIGSEEWSSGVNSPVASSAAQSQPQGGPQETAARGSARLSEADVDAVVAPFLAWLDVPAANRDERGLKQARVKPGTTQYRETVASLRRLFFLVEQYYPAAFCNGVRLAVLVDDTVVQRIAQHLESHRERRSKKRRLPGDDMGAAPQAGAGGGSGGVKAASRYKTFLLLKKVVVYLAGKVRQQSGLDNGPGGFNSWERLLQLCDDANRERDADEADRLLFDDRSEDIMTRDEQHACLAACSQRLQQLRAVPLHQWTIGQRRSFEAHLVTALFLVLAGPRSQILAQMKVGSTLLCPGAPGNGSPQGCYEVQIRARDTKGKKQGALLSIPAEYSQHLAFFITAFLPAGWTGHVWLQRNNKPRTAFTDLTRLVTQWVLGRGIATHRFRHSEVSARPESDGPVLAAVQGNSLGVQRQVYRVQDIREAQQRFATEMIAGGRATHSATGGLAV